VVDSVGAGDEQPAQSGDVTAHIDFLRDIRNRLRQEKHYQLADEIRAKLGELGIALEDTPQGTVWKWKR